MRIYREKDFKSNDFWKIFVPGYKPGETTEDVNKKSERLLEESGVKPLAETDKAIKCGDTISISGKLYSVRNVRGTRCAVRDIDHISKSPDTYEGEDNLYCPYCGEIAGYDFGLPGYGNFRCENCGSLFRFEKECTIEYNSYPWRATPSRTIKLGSICCSWSKQIQANNKSGRRRKW